MADERLRVILELVTGQYKSEARAAGTATDTIANKAKVAGTETGRMGTSMGGAAGAMKLAAVAGGAFVATKIVDFLGDAAKAAADDQKAQELLALAMQNTVGASDESIASMEEWIDQTARATGVADDELRPALANLLRAHKDEKKAQEDLIIAMDIATARGLSVEAVSLAMSKAALGNVGALGRMGIATKDAEGKTMSYEEVLREANKTMGGATARAAETAEGQMRRLQVAFDETKEEIGARLIPILSDLGDALLQTFDDLEQAGDQSFFDEVIGDFKAFGDIANDPHAGPLIDSFRALGEMLGIVDEKLPPVISKTAELSSGMDAARHPTRDHTAAIDDLALAEEEAAGATEELTEKTQTWMDTLRAQTDPVFAAINATDNLRDAQATLAEKQADSTTSTEDLAGAQLAVAEALIDAQGAMDALDPGQLNNAIGTISTVLGISKEETRKLLEQLGLLDGLTVNTYIDIHERIASSIRRSRESGGTGGPTEFAHTGMRIPGRPGTEVPIIALAGEMITTAGMSGHQFSNADLRGLIDALSGGGITIGSQVFQGLPAHLAHQVGQEMALELRMAQ